MGQEIRLIADATLNGAREALDEFLRYYLAEWEALVEEVVRRGLEWGLQRVKILKYKILRLICKYTEYTDNQSLVSQVLAASSRAFVKKAVTKEIAKKVVLETTETVVTKAAGTLVTGVVLTSTGKSMLKAANPVGYVADAAQLGLELVGQKKTGKFVGATGNVASGAMTGMAVGGPVGAAVGAFAGFGLWGAGELVGMLI